MAECDQKTIVLFSGGQDSAVCLFWALQTFDTVESVGFFYGQRHKIELEIRKEFLSEARRALPELTARLGEDHQYDISALGALSDTSLTRDVEITVDQHGLPSTFVPGRNLMFLTLAGALAWRRGARTLVGGMCETDYSGYPDCRRDTLDAQAKALSLGMDIDVRIETPLMDIDKADTWALAHEIGGAKLVDLILEHTHTCYLGDRSKRHDWGYGCGTCPACDLRAKGWTKWQAGMVDPL